MRKSCCHSGGSHKNYKECSDCLLETWRLLGLLANLTSALSLGISTLTCARCRCLKDKARMKSGELHTEHVYGAPGYLFLRYCNCPRQLEIVGPGYQRNSYTVDHFLPCLTRTELTCARPFCVSLPMLDPDLTRQFVRMMVRSCCSPAGSGQSSMACHTAAKQTLLGYRHHEPQFMLKVVIAQVISSPRKSMKHDLSCVHDYPNLSRLLSS